MMTKERWRTRFRGSDITTRSKVMVAHAQGRVGQKAVNNSGAKPESAVLCWLVVRFVVVITVINQFFLCMDICE